MKWFLSIKRKLLRPRFALIACIPALALNVIVYAQAQTPTPSVQWSLGDVAALVGIISAVVTMFLFLVGAGWYIVRGKNQEQLREQRDGWKDTAERLRGELADSKIEVAELHADKKRAEAAAEKLRKLNLRLQGLEDE